LVKSLVTDSTNTVYLPEVNMQDTRIHHERYPLNNAQNVKWA